MGRKLFFFLLIIFLTNCRQENEITYTVPEKKKDGWDVQSLDQAGFNQDKVIEILNDFSTKNAKLDGIIIAKNGKLVLEQYFNGYSSDKPHKIWSITKLITGTVLGIAVDENLLKVTDSIYTYLEEYQSRFNQSEKNITVKHLITMTSGYEWEELGGPKSAGFQLPYSNDWIRFVLDLPHTSKPGEKFNYCSGNTMLLAPIIKKATGLQVREFASRNLFKPLDITNFSWDKQSEFWQKTQSNEVPGAKRPATISYTDTFAALTNTGSGLHMIPRDVCKIGQLYLNGGTWNSEQIISNNWVTQSVQPHFGNSVYGYHWRLFQLNGVSGYVATGFGLQKLYVIPEKELIIVLMQQHYTTMPEGNQITENFIYDLLAA